MVPRLILLLAALVALPIPAAAVTVRDIVALSRAGLPDDILTALIDADRTIFTLDAGQILELKREGVSETVLLKMLRSRREFEPRPEPAPREVAPQEIAPQVVVIGGGSAGEAPAADVAYWQRMPPPFLYTPFPIWGPVPSHGRGRRPAPAPFLPPEQRGFGRFINDGWIGRP
jgi:hypothetical protein